MGDNIMLCKHNNQAGCGGQVSTTVASNRHLALAVVRPESGAEGGGWSTWSLGSDCTKGIDSGR